MDIGPAVGVKKWCEAKANTQRSMGSEYCEGVWIVGGDKFKGFE